MNRKTTTRLAGRTTKRARCPGMHATPKELRAAARDWARYQASRAAESVST
jgi:hypothetical protein